MIGPPSLLRQVLTWSLGAVAVGWTSFVIAGLTTGRHEAEELTDGHLVSAAILLLRSQRVDFDAAERAAQISAAAPNLDPHDYQESLSVMVWDAAGRLLARSGRAPAPPFDAKEGFSDLSLGSPALPWRAYARWDDRSQGRKVMVLLSAEERDGLAWDIARQAAFPGLLLLPVVALLLVYAVRRGMRPWLDLSHDVRALEVGEHDHPPMRASRRHRELVDVVVAINTLVQRQREALERERRLADTVAHELRTPLASLALAARTLQGPLDDAERQEHLQRLEQDALRAGYIVHQLLAMARAGRGDLTERARPVELLELSKRTLAAYADAAVRSRHDLGLEGTEPLTIEGHALLLELALRNLIENALAHTPPGTRVTLQVDAAGRWVQVCDDWPEDAVSTFGSERAARLGLGHRVVSQVAHGHGGRFAEVPSPTGYTRCYRISF